MAAVTRRSPDTAGTELRQDPVDGGARDVTAGTGVGPVRRRRERLEEVAELIAGRGGTANPVVTDATDADSILAGIAEAENPVGTIKIAVNKAGVRNSAGCSIPGGSACPAWDRCGGPTPR